MKHPGDRIVHTSSVTYYPASNSLADVCTASNSKWAKCHSSGYMNAIPFGKNHSNLVSQQIKNWRFFSDWITHLKFYLMQKNYNLHIFIHLIRPEHCQSCLSLCHPYMWSKEAMGQSEECGSLLLSALHVMWRYTLPNTSINSLQGYLYSFTCISVSSLVLYLMWIKCI